MPTLPAERVRFGAAPLGGRLLVLVSIFLGVDFDHSIKATITTLFSEENLIVRIGRLT
jgi:hypothetical protein